jgi:iron complex outermembrane recepter protein
LLLRTTFLVDLNNKSAAAFGQATYEIFPNFRLLAGVRYSQEEKSQTTILTQASFGVGPTTRSGGKATFDKVTWKVGFEWDVGEQNLVYANVATGFKSGGFFIAALDNTFRPEEITAYTFGSKNRFFDNRLQLNLEAFYWDYSEQQINYIGPIRISPTTIGSGLTTTNAGKSRIFGAEVELSYQLTANDLFQANVQLLDGEYEEFTYLAASPNGAPPRNNCKLTPSNAITLPAPGQAYRVDCGGKPQINTPEWSVNLSYEHTFNLSADYDLLVGGRARLEADRFLSPEYLPEERQDSYTQGDVYVTLRSAADWSVTGYVNNVTDETVYAGTSLRPVLPVVYNILRPPRTYGLRVSAQF